ncbi:MULTISPECIES: transglycosylase SLT domain-containing protein [unclassified Agarivorans]|uniref:transglycosylase SLT domain-containing protein n=1 Tax=unclassified Agarivorans TaxID=2636026 RepID=UPI0026E1DF90|nr:MULTISPECIES: transglycosylase SLT domain-containing protein [unclassified Agarivorans]MDO6687665.1 transglycosylase SLT domain-containing protein [Agarivorans sp. 3_MG-2023]MDO6717219.1 transglycosylase SLT domain-containing protein [Agarivorans sp. 2_MG-2023]
MLQRLWQVVVCMICGSSLSLAQAVDLTPQQQAYNEVRKLQRSQKWDKAEKSLAKLSQYPLYNYLQYYQLRGQMRKVSQDQVEQFMQDNPQSYLRHAIQRRFMVELARRKEWQSYLDFYPKLPNSTDLQCYHYYANLKVGDAEYAWQGAESLWLHGRSRPKSCDPLFDSWQKAGNISDKLRWQRMLLSFQANQVSLLKYLSKSLSDSKKSDAKLLIDAYSKPMAVISSGKLKINQSSRHQEIALLAIKRLGRKDLVAAVEHIERWSKPLSKSSSLFHSTERYLIGRVMSDPSPELLKWADRQLRLQPHTSTIERRIRLAISQQQWDQIGLWIARLPEAKQQQERWIYWQARSLVALGQKERATPTIEKLAEERSYHGFLAAQYLGQDYQLGEQLHQTSDDTLVQLNQHPVVLKVKELLALEEYYSARTEWDTLLRRSSLLRQLDLGVLALSHNWQDFAVQASIVAKQWDQLEMRFPLSFAKEFEYFANKRQVEASLLFAVARQESAMYPLAQSTVGARGLMQLMPATAKETARKIGFTYRSRTQLFTPEDNIRLGSAYLDGLLNRYKGNRILAAAAYNAGPHRVSRWLADRGDVPADVWVESIPFKETRHYVQSVLAYQVVYQYRRQQEITPFLTPKELAYPYGKPKG